jgi:2-oxoglutarate dehydrogenase E2 component (dihydrolipoamide succinyltransferase)
MLRRKVAERLVSAVNETAMLTIFNEANMTTINTIRNEYKDALSKHNGVGLDICPFYKKVVTQSAANVSRCKFMMDGDYKIAYDFCDISIAALRTKGLMVPRRNAENLL